MKRKLLFVEDMYCHYEKLYEGLSNTYECFPHINGSLAEFKTFKRLYSDYLTTQTTSIEKELCDYISRIQPDVFIVDMALFEERFGNKIDFSGGVLRQFFLARHFPDTPAIILTQYMDYEINRFMQEGDVHVYKYEFRGGYPGQSIIKHISGIIESQFNWPL